MKKSLICQKNSLSKKSLTRKKKGFTLIELIIVIAIIGILVAIAVPKFGSAQKEAKIKADVASAKNVSDITTMVITNEPNINKTGKIEVKKKSSSESDTLGTKVAEKFQELPKPKAISGSFYISVDNDENVTIYAGTKSDGSDAIEVFPNKDSSYGD